MAHSVCGGGSDAVRAHRLLETLFHCFIGACVHPAGEPLKELLKGAY